MTTIIDFFFFFLFLVINFLFLKKKNLLSIKNSRLNVFLFLFSGLNLFVLLNYSEAENLIFLLLLESVLVILTIHSLEDISSQLINFRPFYLLILFLYFLSLKFSIDLSLDEFFIKSLSIKNQLFDLYLLSPLWFKTLFSYSVSVAFVYTFRNLSYLILNKECLGEGDIDVFSYIGLFFGFFSFLVVFVLSFTISGLFSYLILNLDFKNLKSPIRRNSHFAFVPSITLSFFLLLVFREKIIHFLKLYLSLF